MWDTTVNSCTHLYHQYATRTLELVLRTLYNSYCFVDRSLAIFAKCCLSMARLSALPFRMAFNNFLLASSVISFFFFLFFFFFFLIGCFDWVGFDWVAAIFFFEYKIFFIDRNGTGGNESWSSWSSKA